MKINKCRTCGETGGTGFNYHCGGATFETDDYKSYNRESY